MAAMNFCSIVGLRRLRNIEAFAIAAHALARAVHHLAACRFAPLEHRGDVAVADVEHIVQQEGRAFVRREPLEQRKEGNGEIGGEVEIAIGGGGCVTIGSGSHGPTYASRSVFSRRSRSIASRLVVVTSHASGFSMLPGFASCQRTYASCTMSSASAREPSMR